MTANRVIVQSSTTLYKDQVDRIKELGYSVAPFLQIVLDEIFGQWDKEPALQDKINSAIKNAVPFPRKRKGGKNDIEEESDQTD